MGVTDCARHVGDDFFMLLITVAVHQHDGDGAETFVENLFECTSGLFGVERQHDFAARAHALIDLDYAGIQKLGQHDVAVEDARAVLVSDP